VCDVVRVAFYGKARPKLVFLFFVFMSFIGAPHLFLCAPSLEKEILRCPTRFSFLGFNGTCVGRGVLESPFMMHSVPYTRLP